MSNAMPDAIISKDGFMAKAFPVHTVDELTSVAVDADLVSMTDNFRFAFSNAGYVHDGIIYTASISEREEPPVLLGTILQKNVDLRFYITDSNILNQWIYLKSAKKVARTSKNGHTYFFSEGAVQFPDSYDKPGRTMLTSESTVNRSSHAVLDPGTGKLRTLTPIEAERLQGFDDNWTDTGMSVRQRFFCMGNALVVPMITRMGKILNAIVDNEI